MNLEGKSMSNYLTLKEIQMQELEMFKYFIEFCKKHEITYYLCGGTMLGAIRHQGFIPWDDDIDLFVPRKDFEKLIDLHSKYNEGTSYEVATFRLGNLNRAFIRIFNKNIPIEKEFLDDEYDKYLWIDVFPLDGLPDDEKEVEWIYRKINLYRKMLLWKKARFGFGKTIAAKVFKPMIKLALLPISMATILKKIEKIATKYPMETANYVGEVTLGLHGKNERNPKAAFLPQIDVVFEGLTVKGMANYEQYLTLKYGDYMTLPPEEKRETHSIKAWYVD